MLAALVLALGATVPARATLVTSIDFSATDSFVRLTQGDVITSAAPTFVNGAWRAGIGNSSFGANFVFTPGGGISADAVSFSDIARTTIYSAQAQLFFNVRLRNDGSNPLQVRQTVSLLSAGLSGQTSNAGFGQFSATLGFPNAVSGRLSASLIKSPLNSVGALFINQYDFPDGDCITSDAINTPSSCAIGTRSGGINWVVLQPGQDLRQAVVLNLAADGRSFSLATASMSGLRFGYTGQEILPPPPPAIPEPASWALLILGFGGIGAVQRRKRPNAPAPI
jgi:hypothetical protein